MAPETNQDPGTSQPQGERPAGPAEVPGDGVDRIVGAVEAAKAEILAEFRRDFRPQYEDIEDPVLRGVVEKIAARTPGLAAQARDKQSVELTLDDLFEVVADLIPTATRIEAVDLEIDRWGNDERAKIYAAKNLAAVEAGARVRRVYVISPNVTVAMMDVIEATLIQHLEFNDRQATVREGGRMQIGVLHHEDMPGPEPPRDFAIFDGSAVLFETFKNDWTSTFYGALTKDGEVRTEHSAYFDRTWDAAQELRSTADVKSWAAKMRTRIAEGAYSTDVFVGYAEAAAGPAKEIVDFIRKYGYTVFDWQEHMRQGMSLLDEIGSAREACRLGLFLFTGEDRSASGDPTPRDNVILEYGHFLGGKPPGRVVTVVEEGIEKPTDVEGIKCMRLDADGGVRSIGEELRDWLEDQLGPGQRRSG